MQEITITHTLYLTKCCLKDDKSSACGLVFDQQFKSNFVKHFYRHIAPTNNSPCMGCYNALHMHNMALIKLITSAIHICFMLHYYCYRYTSLSEMNMKTWYRRLYIIRRNIIYFQPYLSPLKWISTGLWVSLHGKVAQSVIVDLTGPWMALPNIIGV